MKDNLEKVNLLARDLRDGKEFPRHRVVYHWFDVYDLEEERL
jgi:hypothetical protein